MNYERCKTGIFRIFVVLTIIYFGTFLLSINPQLQNPDSYPYIFKFVVVPTGLWSIYFVGFWIIKGFLGKK